MGVNRKTALAESVTCGASRVISGEACEALLRCVGGAPRLRFCPFVTPSTSLERLQLGMSFT
jgi:hypothetical protein